MKREVLDESKREEQLKRCPSWRDGGSEISRVFKFESYLKGVTFANALADLAEETNHHPDMLISYCSVTVTLTTHDAGGVTLLDIEMAGRIDGVFCEK